MAGTSDYYATQEELFPPGFVFPKGFNERNAKPVSLKRAVGKGYGDVLACKKPYMIIRGGKGSKKTRTIALMLIARIMEYDYSNALVVRKSYNSLRDTVFTDLLWAIDRLGVTEFWEVRTASLMLIYKPRNQVILFRGLDKAEKLGGLTVRYGFLTWAWIDEFFEITTEAEFEKLVMGLRGYIPPETGLWRQVIGTFNPWSEHCWIKERFFDREDPDVFTKVTTYKFNEFLDESDRKKYDDLYERSPRLAKVICDGEWGVAEGLVYENWQIDDFDPDEIRERPNVQETYGLDFGYKVSYTAFTGTLVDPVAREMWVFEDSIYDTGMTNLDIAKRITALGYNYKRIIADRAEQKSIYELRAGILEEVDGDVVRYSLPNIEGAMKGNDSVQNGISRIQEYLIHVHPRCRNAIMEFSSYYYEQDKDGKYTGKPHKEFDHCLVAGTMVLTDHGQVPIEDVKAGDMVLTHLGYRKVLAAGITRPEPAEIWRITCEDGTVLEGTGDHPFPSDPQNPDDGMCYELCEMAGRKVMNSRGTVMKVVSVEKTGRAEYVYDLTVDEAHDFFANNLITRNCMDSIRYSLEPFINKAKGKVAEAKGGQPSAPQSHPLLASTGGDTPEQTVQHRTRRVASSRRVQ